MVMEECRSIAWTIFISAPAARARVAEVVEADGRQPDVGGELLETVGHVGGVQRLTVGLGEDEVGVRPGFTGGEAFGGLATPVGLEDRDCTGVEGDGGVAAVCLGFLQAGGPALLQ